MVSNSERDRVSGCDADRLEREVSVLESLDQHRDSLELLRGSILVAGSVASERGAVVHSAR